MRIAGIVGIAALVAAGCGPSKPEMKGPDLPDTGKAFGGVQCSAVRPQTEPDLMAWDPGSRLSLKGLANQGVVAVRYEVTGCDVRLEVLSNCIGEGKYEYEPYAANQSKMARNAQELFSELPLGAASLSGKLKNGRALRTDYMLVGMRQLKAGTTFERSQLKGDCSRATHVVNRLYVGGFAMMAGETQSLEAAASVFGVGAGGKQSVAGEVVNNEGVADACTEAQKSAKESPQCAVPLRLGLVPLGAIQAVCPEGTEQKGDQCVRKVAAVECPAGSKWDGSRCAASVDASCASGMHFESGKGCLPNVAADPASPANDAVPRYAVDGDTVHDGKTRLTWQRRVTDTAYTWESADAHCRSLVLAGAGWRLPTKDELLSIVNRSDGPPTVDRNAFETFSVLPAPFSSAPFWTSSRLEKFASAWYVDFYNGSAGYDDMAKKSFRVRCVR